MATQPEPEPEDRGSIDVRRILANGKNMPLLTGYTTESKLFKKPIAKSIRPSTILEKKHKYTN